MNGKTTVTRATFSSFQESTKQDWELIMSQRGSLSTSLPGNILEQLEHLRNDYGGFPVDRLEQFANSYSR